MTVEMGLAASAAPRRMRARVLAGALFAALLAAHEQESFIAATCKLRFNTLSDSANAWPHGKQVVMDRSRCHEIVSDTAGSSHVPTLG